MLNKKNIFKHNKKLLYELMDKKEIIRQLKNAIPKNGVLFHETAVFTEILCKPKLLPLKSLTIKKLEELEKDFEKNNNSNQS